MVAPVKSDHILYSARNLNQTPVANTVSLEEKSATCLTIKTIEILLQNGLLDFINSKTNDNEAFQKFLKITFFDLVNNEKVNQEQKKEIVNIFLNSGLDVLGSVHNLELPGFYGKINSNVLGITLTNQVLFNLCFTHLKDKMNQKCNDLDFFKHIDEQLKLIIRHINQISPNYAVGSEKKDTLQSNLKTVSKVLKEINDKLNKEN